MCGECRGYEGRGYERKPLSRLPKGEKTEALWYISLSSKKKRAHVPTITIVPTMRKEERTYVARKEK